MRDWWSPQQLGRLPETTRGLLIYKIHSVYILYFVFMCLCMYVFQFYFLYNWSLQVTTPNAAVITYVPYSKKLGQYLANLANYKQFAKLFANFYNFRSSAYRFSFTCLSIGAIKASWLTMWPIVSDRIFSSSIATYIACSMPL